MKILAVIVTYRAMPWIDRCLGSLQASGHPADMMVIDNGSDDGTPAYIREHFPQVRLQELGENLGFGKANNIGLRYALEQDYDAVYLMNQDAWVEKDTLETLELVARHNPGYGIFSPFQMSGPLRYDDNFLDRTLSSTPFARDLAEQDVKMLYPVRFVMAAHWLVTRRCLETVGLFAPVFPLYGEDDNYCQRARFHGLGIGIVPLAKAVHDRSERVESKEKIIYRNYRMASLVMLCDIRRPLWMQVLKVLGYTFVKTVRYGSFLPWKHLRELFAQFPEIRRSRTESRGQGAFIAASK